MALERHAHATEVARPALAESDLHLLWSRQLYLPPAMMTEDSRPVVIEFPGVPSLAGPDSRGARILIAGERRVGDVELHLAPAGWELHGHAANVEFANVILHVALWRERREAPAGAVRSFQGAPIPELVLEPFLQESVVGIARALRESYPARAAAPADEIGRLLDAEGDERLREKAERIDRLSTSIRVEELLYREIMAGLGFRQNRGQFEELAALAPLQLLQGRTAPEARAALLWTAGLSEDRPEGVNPDRPRMSASLWRHRGVRPRNYPERRIDAAAALVESAGPRGLCDALLAKLLTASAETPERCGAKLARVLVEWSGSAALGESRAREIVCSALVPFFLSLFRRSEAYELAAFMRDVWWFSPAPPDNFATSFMKRTIFGDPDAGRTVVTNVRRHQGLLGWYARMMR